MPTRKKSTRRRHGGSNADRGLKRAIHMLFQLKGKEYQKEHPDFLIPTADEFFDFADTVNADLKRDSKKTTRAKNTRMRQNGGADLTEFLSFLLQSVIGPSDTPCERFFACIVVVLYAVMTYVFVEQSLLIYAVTPLKPVVDIAKEVLATPAFANSIADPIRWFLANHLPVVVRGKDAIKDLCIEYLRRFLFPMVPSFMSGVGATSESLSTMVISAADMFLVNPRIYNHFFKRPLACMLLAEGFVSCGPICRSAVAPANGHEHID